MPTSIASLRLDGRRLSSLLVLFAALAVGCGTRAQAVDARKPVAVSALEESAEVPGSGADASALERAPTATATYRQTAFIHPASEPGSKLQAFTIAPDGRILALVQLGPGGAGREKIGEQNRAAAGCEVRIFSPDDKHKRTEVWPVSFKAQTMALGPDNCLYVAGSGRVARYSLDGAELAIADSPQSALIEQDQDALREAAEAQIEANKENAKQMTAALQQQRDALQKQIEQSPDNNKQARLKQIEQQIERLSPKEQTIEQAMASITERVKRINAIAASDKEVFITCSQTKGYGYSVWRTDLDFANPKCIVTGLSGCCGQMDVCCAGGDLWVAENSRHRVVRYNREGKRLAAFGKRDRDGEGGSFGGCCNPMNLCFDKDGDILVSESNGQVKRFTAKGEFVELAGVAQVQPGCKNSAVKASPDGESIYYIDVQKSQILILARHKEDAAASNQSTRNQSARN